MHKVYSSAYVPGMADTRITRSSDRGASTACASSLNPTSGSQSDWAGEGKRGPWRQRTVGKGWVGESVERAGVHTYPRHVMNEICQRTGGKRGKGGTVVVSVLVRFRVN